jgi:HTH-type transcriptional regulator / antitoxin HigA
MPLRLTYIPNLDEHLEMSKLPTITPIHSAVDHQSALAEIERLWGASMGTPEGDNLDVLMTLVDAYERETWPDEELDPIDAIKARMENSGRTRKDFEAIAGSSGRASEILNRKRSLTLPMIWKLVSDWKMPADVLVRPYAVAVRDSTSGGRSVIHQRVRHETQPA